MRPAYVAILMLVAAWCAAKPAHAQLFGVPKLDPSFCDQTTYRQTVIYIDDMMMMDGHTEWAARLAGKLRATLAPGEHVTVVQLSPANGQSHELWTACWPAYSDETRAQIARRTYIFRRSPLDRLGDQEKLFLQGLNDALGQIYGATRRPQATVQFDQATAPNKQLLRAIANDEGRFAGSKVTIRAILYSDLAENSDLGSVFRPGSATDYGAKLGSYLRRSVFYDFGLGTDVANDPSFTETARSFWNTALRSMAATVGGIDTDLNVANTIPLHRTLLPVTLQFNGQSLDGKLSLLSDDDGDLVDSWLGISRLTSAALTGSFVCDGAASCRLDAQTQGSLTTTSPSDELILSGRPATGMHGQIGVRGSGTLFSITTAAALP